MSDSFTEMMRNIAEHPEQAFGQIIPIVLIGAVAVIALHLILAFLTRRDLESLPVRWNLWERFIYLLVMLCIAILGSTAFYSVVRHGVMEGWTLLVHMMASGTFVMTLPLLAITWAEANRFGRGRDDIGSTIGEDHASRFFWLAKLMFWIMLASGLVTIATMLASMLPVFDTHDLERLLDIHRYSGLLVVVAAIIHFYAVALRRFELR